MFESLLVLAFGAIFAPVLATLSSKFIEDSKRKRALKRLLAEPLMCVGSRIRELRIEGSDKPLMEHCHVSAHAFGRVEITSNDFKKIACFTGQEYERLHPIYDLAIGTDNVSTGKQ